VHVCGSLPKACILCFTVAIAIPFYPCRTNTAVDISSLRNTDTSIPVCPRSFMIGKWLAFTISCRRRRPVAVFSYTSISPQFFGKSSGISIPTGAMK
jgi:hypothetical protein